MKVAMDFISRALAQNPNFLTLFLHFSPHLLSKLGEDTSRLTPEVIIAQLLHNNNRM